MTSVSTSSSDRPSVTFSPYVGSSGIYDIYVNVPGCASIGDCSNRTSVDITAIPLSTGQAWVTTISEAVQNDASVLVYSGPVSATTSSFAPSVHLALSSNPSSVAGSTYTVVADSVELRFGSTWDGTTLNGSSPNGNLTTSSASETQQTAFGVFEWIGSSQINALTGLSNTTETTLAHLGFALDAVSNSSTASSVNAVTGSTGMIYVAGGFSTTNYSNVFAIDTTTNQTATLAGGLNGVVRSSAAIGTSIYFGGDFASTAMGGLTLSHLARWDSKAQNWGAVAGGVDGAVMDLIASGNQLIVTGNFSHILDSQSTPSPAGGFAIFDTSSGYWTQAGGVYGALLTATFSGGNTYFAGRITGDSLNPTSSFAILSSSNGNAQISAISDISLGSSGSTLPNRRRSIPRTTNHSWISRLKSAVTPRAFVPVSLPRRDTPPSIPVQSAQAPAVLAAAFYTNGSTPLTILGGNFSTTSSPTISGLLFDSSSVYAPAPQVSGIVRSLAVASSELYVGGSFTVPNVGSTLLVYNLGNSTWGAGVPALSTQDGSVPNVNVIKERPNSNTMMVGGNFTQAGGATCVAVCLWDSMQGVWSSPGDSITAGEIRSIDFAGGSAEILLVAGSFSLGGTSAYVAAYSFANSSWSALGNLPGPGLAVAADEMNATNVFAAGLETDSVTPYLAQWNGNTWTSQNGLQPGSIVSSLSFLPMITSHTAMGSIESDRMLLVSGSLVLSQGNLTSALYDGSNWYPYLIGTRSDGTLGSATGLFWSASSFSFSVASFLATGLVVLVAIAIATGLILLFTLLWCLIAACSRRRDRTPIYIEKDHAGSEVSSTHQGVFHSVQAALEQSLLAGSPAAAAVAVHSSQQETYRDDASIYADDEDEDGRWTTMRYEFGGPELQEGEMSMKKGARVLILDDVQSEEWWYARDPATVCEGVIPATYGESSPCTPRSG